MSYYEVRYKIIECFHGWVKRAGGRKRAIIIMYCALTAILLVAASCLYFWQRSFSLDFYGSTFRLESIDRRNNQNMVLLDELGNSLTLDLMHCHTRHGYSITAQFAYRSFSMSYYSFLNFIRFSDGSTVHSRTVGFRQVGGSVLVDQRHDLSGLTSSQVAEREVLSASVRFYERYVEAHVLALIVLGCSLLWLIFLILKFYREEINGKLRSMATTKNYDRLLAFMLAVCLILFLDSRLHVFDNISHRVNSWISEETAAIPLDKLRHAEDFVFGFQIMEDGALRPSNFHSSPRIASSGRILFNPFFDTLIFVRSEHEATGFPDNVVVAWPNTGDIEFERRLELLNREIMQDEHALTLVGATEPSRPVLGEGKLHEKFGLTYPITPDDLVDHWEQVNELIEFLYMRTLWMER